MFYSASAFNHPLSLNTSSVTDMTLMFSYASAFNQPLSLDTSSVTNMQSMFSVRSSPCPAPTLQSTPPLHAACAVAAPMPSCLLTRTSPGIACTPFDSAVRKLLVRRQQAAHPLRVGGHLGLRLCWLWLELGSGDLPGHVHEHGLPEDSGPGLQR